MKKSILIVLLLFVMFVGFAGSAKELKDVNMAVMQGPTGFSSVMLPDYVKVSVYPSPNEAVSLLINGELDMAVLPANTAANLYNKGVKLKALAIVGEGMLKIIGTDDPSNELYVPGAGGTPEHMAMLLYPQYKRNYGVTAPAQLAQMLIAGKCKMAILPQPFVNMVLAKNPDLKTLSDVQSVWAQVTNEKSYPMSVLVATESFAKENPSLVSKVKKDYRASVKAVLEDPEKAAVVIEERGIMKADLAKGAIKDCAIVFKDGEEIVKELDSYYKILSELAPEAIGKALPDSGFYLKK